MMESLFIFNQKVTSPVLTSHYMRTKYVVHLFFVFDEMVIKFSQYERRAKEKTLICFGFVSFEIMLTLLQLTMVKIFSASSGSESANSFHQAIVNQIKLKL